MAASARDLFWDAAWILRRDIDNEHYTLMRVCSAGPGRFPCMTCQTNRSACFFFAGSSSEDIFKQTTYERPMRDHQALSQPDKLVTLATVGKTGYAAIGQGGFECPGYCQGFTVAAKASITAAACSSSTFPAAHANRAYLVRTHAQLLPSRTALTSSVAPHPLACLQTARCCRAMLLTWPGAVCLCSMATTSSSAASWQAAAWKTPTSRRCWTHAAATRRWMKRWGCAASIHGLLARLTPPLLAPASECTATI